MILILYSGTENFFKKSEFYFLYKKYFMNIFPDSGKKIFEKEIKTRNELCSDAGRYIV